VLARNYSPGWLDSLRETIPSGETLVAAADGWTGTSVAPATYCTWVVTQQSWIAIPSNRKKLFGGGTGLHAWDKSFRPDLDRAVRLPLSGIRTVAVSSGSRWGEELVGLTVVSELGRDHFFSPFQEATQVGELLVSARPRGVTRESTLSDELQRLAALKVEGALTAADLERAKDLLLGFPVSQQDRILSHLSQLHGLYKAGVLSESEFNSKKWELLVRLKS
jgi:hypothetical protein